jgi:hypothetical protein
MPGPGINGRFGAAACGILDTFVTHDAGAGFKLPHLAREAGSQLKTADHPADDSRRYALGRTAGPTADPGELCRYGQALRTKRRANVSSQGLAPVPRISALGRSETIGQVISAVRKQLFESNGIEAKSRFRGDRDNWLTLGRTVRTLRAT